MNPSIHPRKNVIIVGTPRSGTSMTAFIFASQGYFAANDPEQELREGDEFNPTGYWEAQRLIDANVALFQAVGYPHHNTWRFDPILEEQAVRLAEVPPSAQHAELVASYEANTPWIWKDPRLCYTLGFWWPLLNRETTAVLLLKRNADHVFKSFLRVGWRQSQADRAEVCLRLRSHLEAAERTIDQLHIPHVAVDYDDFKSHPEETAGKLGRTFGLALKANDLRFNDVLNHSSPKGAAVVRLERVAARLPAAWRGALKRLTPRSLMNELFPGRKL